jgi:flagellar capping protein FliD
MSDDADKFGTSLGSECRELGTTSSAELNELAKFLSDSVKQELHRDPMEHVETPEQFMYRLYEDMHETLENMSKLADSMRDQATELARFASTVSTRLNEAAPLFNVFEEMRINMNK